LPPEDQNEEQTRPSWVTDELLEKTVKVWSRLLGRQESVNEATEMINQADSLLQLIHPPLGLGYSKSD
jgi:hypothetical protein